MHWSHKVTIVLLIIALVLALNYYGVFKAVLKQFKAGKINEEKYVWVDAGQYFEKTTIELKKSGWVELKLKKGIRLPCIIVLNFTEVKYYRQYGITEIELIFDKTWKGKIETEEGTKEVEFTGIVYTTFGGRATVRYGNYYLEPRGLSTTGIVVLDLTKEKVNAHIVKVILFATGVYIKLKIVKIGFPRQ